MPLFEKFTLCAWEVTGYRIALPVIRVEEDGGNRLVPRERAHRRGAKVDDTGSAPVQWLLVCDFYNGITEPGMPAEDMYPDLLNNLVKSFDVHETGTLTLPHIGPRRCRAWKYKRIETSEERDAGLTTLTFLEDNEDATTAASFQSPAARSVAKQQAESTTFSAESAGIDASDLGQSLTELASELEGLANAPGEYVGDLETKAKQIEAACERIEAVHTQAVDEAGKLLTRPDQSLVVRKLRQLRDTTARVVGERLSSMPRLVPKRFGSQRSIFDVATELGQDAQKLMQANPGIEDMLAIPAGTPVLVFEEAP